VVTVYIDIIQFRLLASTSCWQQQ